MLALFSLTHQVRSQALKVEYLVKINTNNALSRSEIKYDLIIRDNESIYFNTAVGVSQFKYGDPNSDTKEIDGLIRVKLDDNTYAFVRKDAFYKGYEKNVLVYNDVLVRKKVIVKESLDQLFKWTIELGKDSLILNYKCQKAVASFRGRKYEAFFTSELGVIGGPWKFDGLPGVILAVRSIDNYFVIKPLQCVLNFKSEKIQNPYKSEKLVYTWDQFVSEFEIKLKQILKLLKSKSESGESGSIKITDRIEDLGIKDMSF